MNDHQPVKSAISPTLPIIMSIIWAIVMIVVLMMSLFTLMAFDSGSVSTGMGMLVAGVWMVVFLCPISIVGGWIAWAVSRRRTEGAARLVRTVLYLLPLVGVLVFILGLMVG